VLVGEKVTIHASEPGVYIGAMTLPLLSGLLPGEPLRRVDEEDD
jgi:hypothetical protein